MSELGSENAKKVPVKAFMILAGFPYNGKLKIRK